MSVIMAKPIVTPRLALLPLRAEHAAEMAAVLADPDLYTFTGGAPPARQALRARYERLIAGSPDPAVSWCNWVIQLSGPGGLAGTVQATISTTSELVPGAAPEPVPEPVPGAAPEPVPEPVPGAVPEPVPGAAAAHEPVPEPADEPAPEPADEPVPGAAAAHEPLVSRHRGSVAEVAWVVGTPWQGQGIATEAARALVAWLAQQSVRTVIAHIPPRHQASAAVAAAAGLAPTGQWHDGEIRWHRTMP